MDFIRLQVVNDPIRESLRLLDASCKHLEFKTVYFEADFGDVCFTNLNDFHPDCQHFYISVITDEHVEVLFGSGLTDHLSQVEIYV